MISQRRDQYQLLCTVIVQFYIMLWYAISMISIMFMCLTMYMSFCLPYWNKISMPLLSCLYPYWHLCKCGVYVLNKSYFDIIYTKFRSFVSWHWYLKDSCDVINDYDTWYWEIKDIFIRKMSFLLLFKSVLLIICTSKIWQYVALLYLRVSGHALSPILFKFLLWTHIVVKRQNTLMFVTGVNRCHVNLVNNEKKKKKLSTLNI